ncbi:MAG: LacI family DNA-binding transcriptional regulator [Actinomycetota bacterium]
MGGHTTSDTAATGDATPAQRDGSPAGASDLATPRRARIEDVAAAAGVSVATVSRALRGLPNVATSTRRRVADVAEQLGYQPDPAATRLAAGRTNTVIVVVPHLGSWYFSNIVAGVEAVCTNAGYDVLVIGADEPSRVDRLIDERSQLERRADGVVLVDIPVAGELAESLARRRVHVATVGWRVGDHPAVVLDDPAVGALAAEHLLQLGHRELGVIGGDLDPIAFEVPERRLRGFRERCLRDGVQLAEHRIVGGGFRLDGGYAAMAALLESEPPTAVFAMSDEMAFGALMALQERGLRPGRDVSVIGVDDHEFAHVVKLTTIRQDVIGNGAAAARALIAALQHADPTISDTVAVGNSDDEPPGFSLVARSTTGPLNGYRPH